MLDVSGAGIGFPRPAHRGALDDTGWGAGGWVGGWVGGLTGIGMGRRSGDRWVPRGGSLLAVVVGSAMIYLEDAVVRTDLLDS